MTTHHTTTETTKVGYMWRCSCGEGYYGTGLDYRGASRDAQWHRLRRRARLKAGRPVAEPDRDDGHTMGHTE